MMRGRLFRASLLIVIMAAFGASLLLCNDASAAVTLTPRWDQEYSSVPSDIVITDTVRGANVIVDKTKINFYKACKNQSSYWIRFNGDTANKFECNYHTYNTDDGWELWTDEDYGDFATVGTKQGVLGDDTSLTIGGSIEVLSKGAATDVATGSTYDVYFKMSNIRIKTGFCEGSEDTRMAVMLGFGTIKESGSGIPSVGTSMFTARSYNGHDRCRSGAIYDVEVRIRDGNGNNLDKSILWAFNDIDIGDRMIGKNSAYVYDETDYPFAEHVKFLSGVLSDPNGYNLSAVEKEGDGYDRELGVSGDTVYHAMLDSPHATWLDGAVNDNSVSILVRVSVGGADGFKFEWGGSTCGTYIDDALDTRYLGQTTLLYDGAPYTSGQPVTISGDSSKAVSFRHEIKRELRGAPGDYKRDDEGYYVWYDNNGGTGESPANNEYWTYSFGGSSLWGGSPFEWTIMPISSGVNNIGNVNLSPGQSKYYTQRMYYRRSNINNFRNAFASTDEKTITLTRPVAKFGGSVSVSVKSGNTNMAIGSDKKVKIASSTGAYTVSFKNNISRNEDGAGGSVDNPWSASVKNADSNATVKSDHGTVSLQEGKNNDVKTLSYEGTLHFGESIKFCGYLNYSKVISYTGNDDSGRAEDCVTIYRENTKCEFDEMGAYAYGLDTAKNYGWVGIKNKTLSNSYTYTKLYDDMSVSIFARPTDEIRFEHRMCAGSLYPIKSKNLSEDVAYTASGWSSKDSGTGNKYLFRDSLPMDNGTFSNPRSWTSTNPRSTFLGNTGNITQNINGWYWSPNASSQNKYRCGIPANDGDPGYYQVAGKSDCGRTGDYNIGIIDAGSTITQKLEWNDQEYSSNSNTFSNVPRAASASVIIPYNYILRPYVTNDSGETGKVAYLGENLTMTPGVVVASRSNTAFSASKRNYATITKPTDINVRYYFKTSSGSIIGESAVAASSRSQARLNSDGLISGTVGSESQKSVDVGGTQLPKVTIPIPNSGVSVGDKVCVEISVYPADSHDAKDSNAVVGTGANDIALSEGSNNSSNWATAVSCSTIAKKPTMSVESSNVYSATQFKTASYARTIGAKKFNFGSWSEYGVFGGVLTGQSSLFASGAAYGYSRDGYTGSAAQTANVARANDDASATGNKVSTSTNSNKCTFMTQTFANSSCNSSSATIGGVMASQYGQRIKERYSSSSGTFEVSGLATKQYNNANYYDVSGYNGSDVIVAPSGIVRFDSKYNLYISSLPNISAAQFAEKGIDRPNHTIVYSAPNKGIVIDGNLGYDDSGKTALDGIAQVIIIAKNVYFTSAPTYVNAIIVADEVNTCRFAGSDKVSIGGKGGASTIGSTQCNEALRFDSPVVVKKIILNRTFGAGNGDEAIRRAEIFNLNMANILWSFNQMSRLSQATTTYLRELPTRY